MDSSEDVPHPDHTQDRLTRPQSRLCHVEAEEEENPGENEEAPLPHLAEVCGEPCN